MRGSLARRLEHVALDVLLYLVLLVFFVPVLWIVLTSVRPNVEINARPPVWIPRSLDFGSFLALLGLGEGGSFGFGANVPFGDYARNSIVAAVASTAISLTLGTLAGFGFSRFRFRGKNTIFLGLMLSRAVPGIALGLPLFVLFSQIGLADKVGGLVIAYSALNIPFTAWLMDGFFREVPEELDEAAMIDGCSRWQAFLRIDLPLAFPGMAASGIFAFLTAWNEFAVASVVARTTASKTFPVGLFDFTGQFVSDWRGMCAMSVIMLVPAVVFVAFVQRHLIRGLTFGALK